MLFRDGDPDRADKDGSRSLRLPLADANSRRLCQRGLAAAGPDSSPRCKPNGVYIEFHPGEEGIGEVYTQIVVPSDPSGNVLNTRSIFANGDATLGGIADADSITDFVGKQVRTEKKHLRLQRHRLWNEERTGQHGGEDRVDLRVQWRGTILGGL